MRTISDLMIPVDDRGTVLAVDVHLPDSGVALASPPVVFFAGPGGGYSKRYFDLVLIGHDGYSQAEYHTARGHIVVAYDHLAVGSSTVPPNAAATREEVAAATAAVVDDVTGRIVAGTLSELLDPIDSPIRVGVGQSMGGCLTVVTQARHRCFDAIAILGFSAIRTVIRSVPGQKIDAFSPEAVRYAWYWDDTPDDIVEQDIAGGYPVRESTPPWGSSTIPSFANVYPGGVDSAGFIREEAAIIDVPLLLVTGERDVVVDPLSEPAAYASAFDVTVLEIPKMAHMHNFASTREVLWRRLDGWARMIASA